MEAKLADQGNRNQSHAPSKNAQGPADGRKAVADYEAEAAAIRAKTERLKALRLAKEAAEGTAAPKRAEPVSRRATRRGKAPSATLSEWLKDQERGGRRT